MRLLIHMRINFFYYNIIKDAKILMENIEQYLIFYIYDYFFYLVFIHYCLYTLLLSFISLMKLHYLLFSTCFC
jgi:hypothetical protein